MAQYAANQTRNTISLNYRDPCSLPPRRAHSDRPIQQHYILQNTVRAKSVWWGVLLATSSPWLINSLLCVWIILSFFCLNYFFPMKHTHGLGPTPWSNSIALELAAGALMPCSSVALELTNSNVCQCGRPQPISHIIHDCRDFRTTKGEQGLRGLDEDTIKWLKVTKLPIWLYLMFTLMQRLNEKTRHDLLWKLIFTNSPISQLFPVYPGRQKQE